MKRRTFLQWAATSAGLGATGLPATEKLSKYRDLQLRTISASQAWYECVEDKGDHSYWVEHWWEGPGDPSIDYIKAADRARYGVPERDEQEEEEDEPIVDRSPPNYRWSGLISCASFEDLP